MASTRSGYQKQPYFWGMFQGWTSLAGGLFGLGVLIAFLAGNGLAEGFQELAICSPLLLISGYAFVRRRPFAALIPYIWIGFEILLYAFLVGVAVFRPTTGEEHRDVVESLIRILVQCIFWGCCAVYYHERRDEFVSEAAAEKHQPEPLAKEV